MAKYCSICGGKIQMLEMSFGMSDGRVCAGCGGGEDKSKEDVSSGSSALNDCDRIIGKEILDKVKSGEKAFDWGAWKADIRKMGGCGRYIP